MAATVWLSDLRSALRPVFHSGALLPTKPDQPRDPVLPPVRLITRHALELHVSSLALINDLCGGVDDEAIFALVVLRVCLQDWLIDDRPITPANLRRSTSVHSMAISMGRAYASTHRLVTSMEARGLVVRRGGGVAISNDASQAAKVIRFLEDAHDILCRFIESLEVADVLSRGGERSAGPRAQPHAQMVAMSLDIMLMPYELFRGQIGDWTSKKLWLVLSAMTTRHVTTDPELDRRYAIASTPNEERRSVDRHTLADLAYVPPSTAWRHLKEMYASGVIARRADGWVLLTNQLLEQQMEESVRASTAFYLRHIDELRSQGLDPANISYLRGRPPLIEPPGKRAGR